MFNNIKAELARNCMTQSELAEYLNVSRETVVRWINGTTDIPVSAIRKMAALWNVSADYLISVRSNT